MKINRHGALYYNPNHNEEKCPECKSIDFEFEVGSIYTIDRKMIEGIEYECEECQCIWYYEEPKENKVLNIGGN